MVLITIDTLRADHMGIYGYERNTTPNIDRWFGDGLVYERCYSTDASTAPSVVSILTGMYPAGHGVRLFFQLVPDEIALLPDLLPADYRTAAFVSNMVLTDEAMGIGDRFDHFDDFVDERESNRRNTFERNARRTTDAVLRWLNEGRDRTRPLLLWVHYIDPHGPYVPPADWKTRFTSEESLTIDIERVPFYTRQKGVDDGMAYVDGYDSEIAYVDSEIGRLLDGFEEVSGSESLVILTADHGESMMDHESWFTHGYHVYDEIMRVPLLLRGPGVQTGRFTVLTSGIDIASTILRFAGADATSAAAKGVDLTRPASLDPERTVYLEAGGRRSWRGAVRQHRKVVFEVRGKRARIVEGRLYDLDVDPAELDAQPSDSAALLTERLKHWIGLDRAVPEFKKGTKINAPKVSPRATEEDLEALRKLGYVE